MESERPAFDPGELIAHIAIVMFADIVRDLSFEESSEKFLAEFGERVRPYLAKAWERAQQRFSEEFP